MISYFSFTKKQEENKTPNPVPYRVSFGKVCLIYSSSCKMNVAGKKKKIMLELGLAPECFVVSVIKQFLNIRTSV